MTTSSRQAPLLVRLVLFGAGCGSVLPLLAWVYDLGTFAHWSLAVGGPLVVVTIVTALALDRTGAWPDTRNAIRAGALGGLVGTAGYDLFRVPFVYGLGLALLAPIDSYGVLLLGADHSSAWTGIAGWGYHTTNGVGFAVAYAVMFRGKHWGYGIAWAMVLESASVFTPFGTSYNLRGEMGTQWLAITLAYCAHVPFGYAIGRAAQNADTVSDTARGVFRAPVLASVLAVAVALTAWQRPFAPDDRLTQGNDLAAGPSAVIINQRWYPQWLRVPVNGCLTLKNTDAVDRTVGKAIVAAGATVQRCYAKAGITRVKVDDKAFSGGFVIVDDQIR